MRITKREDLETEAVSSDINQTTFTFSEKTETPKSKLSEERIPKTPDKNPPPAKKSTENYPSEKPVTIHFQKSPNRTPDQSHLSIQRTVNEFEIGISEKPHTLDREDATIEKNAQERINKLKNLSRIHSGDVNKFETEPAFRRKNIEIDNTPPSTQSPVSKFTLGEDSKNNPVIKSDNSYLHDNVD